MGGFFGVVAYAVYNYRRKAADTKTSVYVIQTRVAAQGLVISILALGACLKMYYGFMHRDEPKINAFHRNDDHTVHDSHKTHDHHKVNDHHKPNDHHNNSHK